MKRWILLIAIALSFDPQLAARPTEADSRAALDKYEQQLEQDLWTPTPPIQTNHPPTLSSSLPLSLPLLHPSHPRHPHQRFWLALGQTAQRH